MHGVLCTYCSITVLWFFSSLTYFNFTYTFTCHTIHDEITLGHVASKFCQIISGVVKSFLRQHFIYFLRFLLVLLILQVINLILMLHHQLQNKQYHPSAFISCCITGYETKYYTNSTKKKNSSDN